MSTIAVPGSNHWITDACREFSRSVGWELQFFPLGNRAAGDVETRLRNDPETCWFSELTDGSGRFGFLVLNLPAEERRDRLFPTVSDVAEILAGLISRSATALRQAESRTSELATLVDIGRSIPSEGNLADSVDRLLRGATQLTAFRSAAFFLLDPSTECLKLRALSNRDERLIPAEIRKLSEIPPDLEALARGRVILTGTAVEEAAAWLPNATTTAVCLAVGSEAGPIGTLWVYDRRRREPTEREIHVLESIGVQISSVLERVVLLRESAVQHRLQRDLQLASQCHAFDDVTALIPGSGIEAAIRSSSRFEIGGDLCELIPLDVDRTIFAIGDASGHGVSAAIVMSVVRGAVRALALDPRSCLPTEEVLVRINRALHSVTPSHQFMSFLYGLIDTRQMTLTYSNAGHPCPILMKEGKPTTLDSHGMLLGVLAEAAYGASTLPIASGDVLLAFTDGVSEAMNGKRKMFRSDGVVDVLGDTVGQSPREIVEAIWSQLESHLDGATGHDDRSLMAIRIR